MVANPGAATAPTPTLKARIAAGDQLLGVLLRVPSEELVEMSAVTGFDFVFLDGEHGPPDVVALRGHLAVAALHGVPTLVRVGGHEPALVLRALDAGAAGVITPHVDDAAGATAVVDAAHYPPLGNRGFATYGRAGRFGLTDPETHRQTALAETVVVVMIESPVGVANTAEIVAVPGVDVVMIGVADLAASSTPQDPTLPEAVRLVNDTLAASPVARMDIVPSRTAAEAAFADGAQLVVYNLTAALMAHLAELNQAR
jgi:4-hydroxy-2-oxoheptanedioate aldolase